MTIFAALSAVVPAKAGRYLLPSPLRGRVGGGGQQNDLALPPSPTLPRKGGGSAARKRGEGADRNARRY